MLPLLVWVSITSAVSAQQTGCLPDLLVDDFSTAQRAIVDGADRQVNKLGGDYGTDGPLTRFTVNTQTRELTVFTNPDIPKNFLFIKFVSN
jgi:hypothetical protein